MICINRIKPLKPKTLFKYERWMILGAFVLAVIMNPTPNLIDQIMLAGPMILMYQVGIGIIWLINRSGKPSRKIQRLLEADAVVRAERESRLASAVYLWKSAETIASEPVPSRQTIQAASPAATVPVRAGRPQQYADNFAVTRRGQFRPAIETIPVRQDRQS
jgi:hypothetical protein